ncbi:hypothetical protein [Hydrogenophaga crocea]|uniref:Uncharacterized protein n=1 Tax=Hydrogenophaga crocea TaxID=2716225 RepID=A0A6G8IHQ0_9BURK|nr:hypothetical protein [Hydrogenophaga crocea]QIM52661.1 hypothetical protein G9Q37_11115 [Hydrogenophaga crocea]
MKRTTARLTPASPSSFRCASSPADTPPSPPQNHPAALAALLTERPADGLHAVDQHLRRIGSLGDWLAALDMLDQPALCAVAGLHGWLLALGLQWAQDEPEALAHGVSRLMASADTEAQQRSLNEVLLSNLPSVSEALRHHLLNELGARADGEGALPPPWATLKSLLQPPPIEDLPVGRPESAPLPWSLPWLLQQDAGGHLLRRHLLRWPDDTTPTPHTAGELQCLAQRAVLVAVNRSLYHNEHLKPPAGEPRLRWSLGLNRFTAALRPLGHEPFLSERALASIGTALAPLIDGAPAGQAPWCHELVAQRLVQPLPAAFLVEVMQQLPEWLVPRVHGELLRRVLCVAPRHAMLAPQGDLLTLLMAVWPQLGRLPAEAQAACLFEALVLLRDTEAAAGARATFDNLVEAEPGLHPLQHTLDTVLAYLQAPAQASPEQLEALLAHLEREPAVWGAADLVLLQVLAALRVPPTAVPITPQTDVHARRVVALLSRFLRHLCALHRGEAAITEHRALAPFPGHVLQAALATLDPDEQAQIERAA